MHEFVSNEPLTSNGNKTFYQICYFSNPNTGKYHIRKFVINSDYIIKKVKNYKITKSIYNKLLHKKRDHEYKMYSTYDLDNVKWINPSDILISKSEILGNDYSYSGFAPF
jgi:hypothetical protein